MRNNADRHRLLELAALAKTLILDEDGISDPSHFNDRLLFGLNGTMSEAEMHVLKARLLGGQRNEACRGELEMAPPLWRVYDPMGQIGLDPDQQIEASVRMIFDTFRKIPKASALRCATSSARTSVPRGVCTATSARTTSTWTALDHSRAIQILHAPGTPVPSFMGARAACPRPTPTMDHTL